MPKEIGSSGLIEWHGIISEDFLREWRLPQSYQRANEMRLNSPIVAALLTAIEQSIRRVDWQMTSEAGDTDPRLEIWDACMKMLEGGWDDFVIEALSFVPFGFSLFELVWGQYDNWTILLKLAPRKQDTVYRWEFGDSGSLQGFVQLAAPLYKQVTIPIEKLLHLTSRSENGNPEGRSVLRTAWIPYYYAKNIMQIEAIGIERDLAGLPVIHLPSTANTDTNDSNSDASRAAKLVRNIRQDEQAGIVLPDGWALELLSTGGSRQFDTDKIVTRYESRILMTALAQFLMLGQQNVGSLALSRDQSDMFVMSVNAVCDIIQAGIEGQVLPRLMALNGYDAEGLRFTHTPAGDTDITSISDAVQKLSQAGFITPMPEDEEYFRKAYDLPEIDIDEIQAERDAKRAQAAAISGAIQQAQNREQPTQPTQGKPANERDMTQSGEPDQNAAVIQYFASERPDDVKRRRFYRELERNIQGVLDKAAKGVKKYAREAMRG